VKAEKIPEAMYEKQFKNPHTQNIAKIKMGEWEMNPLFLLSMNGKKQTSNVDFLRRKTIIIKIKQ
jgi:hypothetical protein